MEHTLVSRLTNQKQFSPYLSEDNLSKIVISRPTKFRQTEISFLSLEDLSLKTKTGSQYNGFISKSRFIV